jgi:tryptophan-rich sensory protein
MFDRQSWLSLVPFILVCFAAGAIGAGATRRSVRNWYPTLHRPVWTPPDWVFAPVWSTLYLMMALSAWLIWRDTPWTVARPALVLFVIQLALNSLWTVLFFGLRSPGIAFAEILLLFTMIVATATAFLTLSFLAAWLLIPYAIWVSFASYLNFRIWQLN